MFLVKSVVDVPAQIRKNKSLRKELGRWYSIHTRCYSRVTDSALIILFLLFDDRDMKFTRWQTMLDEAITKVDSILSETSFEYLDDRRFLLLTVKSLFKRFSENVNFNDNKQPVESLRVVFKNFNQ